VSRSIDNRIARTWWRSATLLAQDRPKHAGLFGVATTREEIAWTAAGPAPAVGLEPNVALVVDVTHATDWPGAEKKRRASQVGGVPSWREGRR